jgi:hypothetical protein
MIGTVGLMTLPILGAAEGFTEEEASKPAIALGIGLQLTNILRDVGEDLERGMCSMQARTTVHAFIFVIFLDTVLHLRPYCEYIYLEIHLLIQFISYGFIFTLMYREDLPPLG